MVKLLWECGGGWKMSGVHALSIQRVKKQVFDSGGLPTATSEQAFFILAE